jgi:hypothetical protein
VALLLKTPTTQRKTPLLNHTDDEGAVTFSMGGFFATKFNDFLIGGYSSMMSQTKKDCQCLRCNEMS